MTVPAPSRAEARPTEAENSESRGELTEKKGGMWYNVLVVDLFTFAHRSLTQPAAVRDLQFLGDSSARPQNASLERRGGK